MKKVLRFIFSVCLSMLLFAALGCFVHAHEAVFDGSEISAVGVDAVNLLTDSDEVTPANAQPNASITLSRDDGIGFVYIIFDKIPGEWTLSRSDGSGAVSCGVNNFLHEYVPVSELLDGKANEIVLSFPNGASIAEIYVFSPGEVPEWVQRWEVPYENGADLLMFSSHSDDEQLFFAGVLPYYAGERELRVQVVYIVSHFDTHERPHEQLNGLWTVGVRAYPIISDFPDLYSESRDGALEAFASYGIEYEDFVEYVTENIRRFKPLVVVSHDLNGEYGHGTHILCSSVICDAADGANDPSFFADSAVLYGTWKPEKIYFHLYSEAQITLDLDSPLEKFGGKSAFRVTQDGFACHTSQHWTWFNRWIYGTADFPITRADQIDTYSPMYYGLYFTSVGSDTLGGDFFENVVPYDERSEQSSQDEETTTDTETVPPVDEIETVEAETSVTADHDDGDTGGKLIRRVVVILSVIVTLIVGSLLISGALMTYRAKRRRRRRRRR